MTDTPETTLWKIVNDVTFCMLVTWDGERLRSRPMTLKSDEASGELQFLASVESATVAEIGRHPTVNLTFAEPKQKDYVSISGQATIDQDRALISALWTPYAGKFFGGGPETADVTVIRVKPDRAEYWDGDSHDVTSAWTFLKGVAGNGSAPQAEHGKVEF